MNIKGSKKGQVLIIQVTGELDHHSAPEFIRLVEAKLKDQDISVLELDCKGLSFMDSSGIGAMLGRSKTMKRKNGKMRSKNLRPKVKKIFEMCGLCSVIESVKG